ncbi:MAG: helix-turn-helix transcriptional regulator [Armatimonadetes bacterium]|nr:helix-turn-helix transcriptional regulator [Armatimonadota bacterium]MDW8122787.1 helix-turn-helix transcriptional regulator [Armatimonadota bacterium]
MRRGSVEERVLLTDEAVSWGLIVRTIRQKVLPRLHLHWDPQNNWKLSRTSRRMSRLGTTVHLQTVGGRATGFLIPLDTPLLLYGNQNPIVLPPYFCCYLKPEIRYAVAPNGSPSDGVHRWIEILVCRSQVAVSLTTCFPERAASKVSYWIKDPLVHHVYHLWEKEAMGSESPPSVLTALLSAFLTALTYATPSLPRDLLPSRAFIKTNSPVVTQALRLLYEGYQGPLRLAHLARQCGVSPPHLCRLFRHHLGLTPSQVLARIRVDLARQLLRTTSWTTSDVAFSCGFTDLRRFQRVFRRLVGQTPGAYRSALHDRSKRAS